MAVSFGLSIGVILVPAASQQLPELIRQVVATPITLAGLSAIVLSLAIPARTEAAPDKDETPAAGPA
jgi:xanthine permease XanP